MIYKGRVWWLGAWALSWAPVDRVQEQIESVEKVIRMESCLSGDCGRLFHFYESLVRLVWSDELVINLWIN